MTEAPGFLLYVAAFLLLLGPLVFVHEFGHYIAGRWFGVKAEEFSIGFGGEVAGVTDTRGTRWKFGWLPLGGYVKFAGDMNPASVPTPEWLQLPPSERSKTFQAKPLWQRAIIVAAGPFVNLALAVLILAGFALVYGEVQSSSIISAVQPGSPAASAGLRAGDRIAAIDGERIDRFGQIVNYVKIRPAERVTVAVERGGANLTIPLTIGAAVERDRFGNEFRIGQMGILSGAITRTPVAAWDAPLVGLRQTGQIISTTFTTLGQIVTGRRSVKEMGGPLRIAKVSGEQLSLGWPQFVFLVALISINLGFINLLPVPILDGGHLMLYAVEAVRRRPASPRAMEWAFRGGLAAILALMLLVTFNDLGSFGLWRGIAGLIG